VWENEILISALSLPLKVPFKILSKADLRNNKRKKKGMKKVLFSFKGKKKE